MQPSDGGALVDAVTEPHEEHVGSVLVGGCLDDARVVGTMRGCGRSPALARARRCRRLRATCGHRARHRSSGTSRSRRRATGPTVDRTVSPMCDVEPVERRGAEHDLARSLDHATVDDRRDHDARRVHAQERDVRPVDVRAAVERAAPRFDVGVGRERGLGRGRLRVAVAGAVDERDIPVPSEQPRVGDEVLHARTECERRRPARLPRRPRLPSPTAPTPRSNPAPGADREAETNCCRRRKGRRARAGGPAACPRGPRRRPATGGASCHATRPMVASRVTVATSAPAAEHRPVGVEAGVDLDPAHRSDRHRRRCQHRADHREQHAADDHRDRRARSPTRGRSGSGRHRAPARVSWSSRSAAQMPCECLADEDESREPDDDAEHTECERDRPRRLHRVERVGRRRPGRSAGRRPTAR